MDRLRVTSWSNFSISIFPLFEIGHGSRNCCATTIPIARFSGSRRIRLPSTTPYTTHPSPSPLHPKPHTHHHTPYTLHRTPYTLHPTPYTVNRKPTTQNSQPSTLDSKPSTLNNERSLHRACGVCDNTPTGSVCCFEANLFETSHNLHSTCRTLHR